MDSPHPDGKSTAVTSAGKHIVRTVYGDGVECVEEFDVNTQELLVRRWMTPNTFGHQGKWEYEIGEPNAAVASQAGSMLRVSSSNPIFVASETPTHWEWRVRNIPYPIEVYNLSIDDENQTIVLRTSNKKYFKRFHIPALRRAGKTLDPALLQVADYSNQVLMLRYRKPMDILEMEANDRKQKLTTQSAEGNVDCKQQ